MFLEDMLGGWNCEKGVKGKTDLDLLVVLVC